VFLITVLIFTVYSHGRHRQQYAVCKFTQARQQKKKL